VAAATCPRCTRILPPGASTVCVYCGTQLSLTPTRDPSLGFGFAARPAQDPQVGNIIAGRFRIDEMIGQGGMGKVYRAQHLALDRTVCLKMLKPALLEDPTLVGRFEREAKAASRLNHPNAISVLDFGRNDLDGSLYIVMEYVQGKDLRLVLRDEWPLAEQRLCNIMAQVLAALAEAHAHNVIHRDLKPENIMIEQRRDQADFVKVLDFGIAKILDSDVPGLTRNDVVCGTPQYMAPEQATGSALDQRCDLYAVGVILSQLATGYLPFDGQNSMEVLTRHVNELPVPPRQRQPDAPISEAMEALILRALEKEPGQRPQTAEEFRQLLQAVPARAAAPAVTVALVEPVAAPPVEAGAAPRSRLRPGLLAGGAAALVAVAGVAGLRSRRAPADVPALSEASTIVAAPRRDPAKAQELVTQAKEWLHKDNTAAARDLFEKAAQLDPDNAEAHHTLGALFLESQPDRARQEYELSKKLNPQKYGDDVDLVLKAMKGQ
jgi:tRNA A-37 threonylcarbamoyl transferase component Bud32